MFYLLSNLASFLKKACEERMKCKEVLIMIEKNDYLKDFMPKSKITDWNQLIRNIVALHLTFS